MVRTFRPGTLAKTLRHHTPLISLIAWTSGARAYTAFTTLIALVLTVRWLGAEGRGIVVVVTTWVVVSAHLGSLTLSNVGVHRSVESSAKSWLGPFLGAMLMLCALSSTLIWLIVSLLYASEHASLFAGIPPAALALGFVALPFLMWEYLSSTPLSLVGRLKTHNVNQVAARTAGIVIMVVAIQGFGLGVYGFLIAFVCTELIIATVALVALIKASPPQFVEGFRQLPRTIGDGLKVHLQTIGGLLFSSADILLLYHFHGAAAAAVYQFSSAIFFGLMLIPQSGQLTLQSRLGSAGVRQSWPEQRIIIAVIVIVTTLAAAVVWVLAPWLTITLATPEFRQAEHTLRIMLFALPAAAFALSMSVQWSARGNFLELGLLYFSMGILSLCLNLFLVPRYGATGAAVTTLIIWYSIPLVASISMAVKAERDRRRHSGVIPNSVEPTKTPLNM